MDFVECIADGRGRKRARGGGGGRDDGDVVGGGDVVRRELLRRRDGADSISWGSAVEVIEGALGARPHPPNGSSGREKGLTESAVHVPVMERARGTTYEEKVRSILATGKDAAVDGVGGHRDLVKSSKRKERYEANIIGKRKTTEEDAAFYNHMLQQGGSSI